MLSIARDAVRAHPVRWLAIAAALAAGIFYYPKLPAEMVVHWSGSGPDGFLPRPVAVVTLPALAAGLAGLFRAVPRIDPLGENIAEFRDRYDEFVTFLVVFLAYVHGLVLWWNLGGTVDIAQALVPGVAGLYAVTGRVVRNAHRNWFVGFRTPWTLSDEDVWDRTHERVGPLFYGAAAVALLGLVLPEFAVALMVAPVVAIAVAGFGYSYWLYRERH